MLLIPHDHCGKKIPNDYLIQNRLKVTHLFDRKGMIVETVRKHNNGKRRMISEKFHDSACRTMNFTTGMGLSFECTKSVGARFSEKKITEEWGKLRTLELNLESCNGCFK